MKSVFSSRRNKSPHTNEEGEKETTPFFSKKNKTPFFKAANGAVQTKLTIGQPGDKYEKEADSMADAVVNNSSKPDIQHKEISNIQRESLATPQDDEKLGTAEQRMEEDKLVQEKPEIQRMEAPKEEEMINKMEEPEEKDEMVSKMDAPEEKEEMVSKMDQPEEEKEGMVNKMEAEEPQQEEEGAVQTKSNANGGQTANTGLSKRIKSKAGKGQQLPKRTKTEMESSFGNDFSQVNIHTDQEAVRMNKQLGAQAFTYGKDIYFNSGKFDPKTKRGRHLLAHELTHVVQQGKGISKRKIQRMSAAQALRIGMNLSRRYPGWLRVLPNCPCTYRRAMRNPAIWKDATSPWTSSYHPGANNDVRTVNGYSTTTGTSHGQQCTYDRRGRLITSGPGAGTPDVWTPNGFVNFFKHQAIDVDTYNALGSNVYVRYWRPNNGNGCRSNSGSIRNVPLTSSSERKIVAIRDLLYGWTSNNDVNRIIRILRTVRTRREMAAIRSDISPLLVPYLSDIGDRTRIRVALRRL